VVTLSQVMGAGGTPAAAPDPASAPPPSAAMESRPGPIKPVAGLSEAKKKSPEPIAAGPTAFEPGHVVVATLAPARNLAPAALEEAPTPAAESEYGDMEPDPDYPADAEDPDAPPSHMSHSGPSLHGPQTPRPAEDPVAVPVQASPVDLPALWPRLVAELCADRPLLGSHLLRSRLAWEDGETPGLRVVFLERGAWSLIGEDTDTRKTIQAFLASKAEGGREAPVRFSLDPEAAASLAPAAAIAENDPLKREPIIGFIQELFEGRML